MTITVVLDPPLNTDSPTVFATKAARLVLDLSTLSVQINAEITVTIPGIVNTVVGAAAQAVNEDIPAAVALVDAAVAETYVRQAGDARDEAVAARIVAVASAESVGGFTTLALANAALAAIAADKGIYVTADGANNGFYVKRAGALVRESTATLPAVVTAMDGLSALLATRSKAGITGVLAAWLDSYGRAAGMIGIDGRWTISKLTAKTAIIDASLFSSPPTLPGYTVGIKSVTLGKVNGILAADLDRYGRLASAQYADGSLQITQLRDNTGALVYPQLAAIKTTADAALAAAASGGASDFRRTMVAAQSAWGQYPRPSLAVPPTLTLTGGNPAAPAGTTLIPWNAAGKWRTSGGFTSQFGANPYLQWKSSSPNGNAGGMTRAGGTSIETIHTGTALWVCLRGAGGPLRVLVGDAQGKHLAYVSKAYLTPAPDGNAYQLLIDFGVSATRTIVIEGNGGFQLGGIYVKTGESITAPLGVKPLVCCMGSSITEMDHSWARWLGYLLGADVYNVGVGSSGIINPGVAPKVKQIDRSNDITIAPFLLGIEEAGINDSGDAFYSAATYAAVSGEFAGEYRRVLDAWFTAHPASPFIGWGPFWPNDAPVANIYRIRDAKQRVCSEYPLAAFIDTLTPTSLIKGSPAAVTYPAADYFAPYVAGVSDVTHPIEVGNEFVGQALFSAVDRLIRTRF